MACFAAVGMKGEDYYNRNMNAWLGTDEPQDGHTFRTQQLAGLLELAVQTNGGGTGRVF